MSQVDQIIVMKEGKISEIGTYNELMQSKGAFADFLLEQMSQGQDQDGKSDGGVGSMSESELEELKHALEENLGMEELQKKLAAQEARERKRRARKRGRSSSLSGLLSVNSCTKFKRAK